ncbi:hypothetical protein FG167_13595 [Lacinutrix sp. WUR7]|uniref:hypothetical protein n=1 Tax=Lacinutrix sp. WUR7 TaxID=2653681 RepID=UPI00193E387D|nr:hypothetical protein [Lacinutrix sp. WUR7]QRM90224.1 hypothetical protein FG167_13595 [Lacinutrix sp. WUR7]
MKTNNNIQEKIDNTFKAFDAIEEVTISPFFKDKTMQRLFSQQEEEKVAWSWFSPKLQLATLICIVALNVLAFSKFQETKYEENVNLFAETYGLSTSTETLLLN